MQNAFSDTLRNKHFSPVIKQPFTYYKTETRYLVLRLKPLRERTEDIPGIATLYISQINNELGKQIVGFEPEAMALMKQYSWRENLSQFKRISVNLFCRRKAIIFRPTLSSTFSTRNSLLIPTQAAATRRL